MVTFVCEECNETLKKSVVARHACVARGGGATCVDCSRTFYGAEHAAHTSCVSEAEKYKHHAGGGGGGGGGGAGGGAAAGGSGGGAGRDRKEKHDPQAAWTELISRAAAQQAPGSRVAPLLRQLAEGYGNVPRKLKPFLAFGEWRWAARTQCNRLTRRFLS